MNSTYNRSLRTYLYRKSKTTHKLNFLIQKIKLNIQNLIRLNQHNLYEERN